MKERPDEFKEVDLVLFGRRAGFDHDIFGGWIGIFVHKF
jgi:hypothetical protein